MNTMWTSPVIALLIATSFYTQQAAVALSTSPITRRDIIGGFSVLPLIGASKAVAAAEDPAFYNKGVVVLHLENGDAAGLELYDVTIGSKTLAAIKRILPDGKASRNPKILPGMVLSEDALSIIKKLRQGPYPLDLEIRNLAASGDAFGDLGKPLVTAEDALQVATTTTNQPGNSPAGEFAIRKMREVPTGIQSRRGDVLEINYEAFMRGEDGVMYDSSAQRGTGQPYQFVLGSGDMIPGVDQGCYDMRAGEKRTLEIPALLAFGSRGSRMFSIPGNTKLVWKIELVAVNSIREGDERTRDEIEGRFAY